MALPAELTTGEIQKRTIAEHRDINWHNTSELRAVLQILNDRRSKYHFISPPRTLRELRRYAQGPDIHMLIFNNCEGDMVSTLTVEDSVETDISAVNSHEISRIAVRADLQSPPLERSTGPRLSVGLHTLVHGLDYFFSTPTHRGRDREDAFIWITSGLPGWERMEAIAKKTGFRHSMTGTHFVTKKFPGKREELYDASRYDLPRGRYVGLAAEGHYDSIVR